MEKSIAVVTECMAVLVTLAVIILGLVANNAYQATSLKVELRKCVLTEVSPTNTKVTKSFFDKDCLAMIIKLRNKEEK